MAYRAWTDVQLLCGLAQTQMPGGGLEGPQRIERRHLMHEKISLIGRNHILCHPQKQRNIEDVPQALVKIAHSSRKQEIATCQCPSILPISLIAGLSAPPPGP